MRLFMALYAGPHARIVGGPSGQAIFDTKSGVVTRMLEVAYPPFASNWFWEGDEKPKAVGVRHIGFHRSWV